MEYYRYVIVALQYHKLIDSASHNLAQFNGIHATTCALFQHFIRELLQWYPSKSAQQTRELTDRIVLAIHNGQVIKSTFIKEGGVDELDYSVWLCEDSSRLTDRFKHTAPTSSNDTEIQHRK